VALVKGTAMDAVPGMVVFTTPEGNDMFSILLTPIPVKADNLNLVVDAGWISVDDLCKDVPAGEVAVCG
jgi:D-xylose transport system substrate-binding protein